MRPLSVIKSDDIDAIRVLINIHSPSLDPFIWDCTYNAGRIWKKSNYHLIKSDINAEHEVDFVADFRKIPLKDNSCEVIVFDPPHLPAAAGSVNSSKIWEKRFGNTADKDSGREGYNINRLFEPFLIEAKRVLVKNGIILAKIIDIVHNHQYQWQHIAFVNDVKKVKLTPCDMLIKVSKTGGNLTSGRWKNIKHLRRCHAYWIVVRKGKCERKCIM